MKYRYSIMIDETRFSGIEDMFATLQKLGYSALDSSGGEKLFSRPEEESAYCKKFKTLAGQYDFLLYQTHAPILINQPEETFLGREYRDTVMRSLERASRLGIQNIVIHPFVPEGLDFFRAAMPYDYTELEAHNKEVNLQFFSQFIPFLKAEGLTMCIENLFAYDILMQRHVLSACGNPDETNFYIDNLGDCFAACYDSGHLNHYGGDEYAFITALKGRVRVVHLHDSWGKEFKGMDWHMMPGQGDVNWKAVKKGLEETGFSGTINAEISPRSGKLFMPMLVYIRSALGALFEN